MAIDTEIAWMKAHNALDQKDDADCRKVIIEVFPDLIQELQDARMRIKLLEMDNLELENEVKQLKEDLGD
jgi:hypothetical protein